VDDIQNQDGQQTLYPSSGSDIERIDSAELAKRIGLPETWIRAHSLDKNTDVIPHLHFGHYVRFEWNSEALNAWIDSHRHGYSKLEAAPLSEGPADQKARKLASPLLRMGKRPGRGANLAREVYCNRTA